ncbi:MAG: nickel pincer cofactor biosynthesis protein LarB [Cyanobacteria bacterium P01_F01_bin.53]
MTQPDALRDTYRDDLRKVLQAVAAGHLSPEVAFEKLSPAEVSADTVADSSFAEAQGGYDTDDGTAYESVGDFAKIDHQRTARTGFPEVIWGEDKTAAQIVEIMRVMEPHHPVVMATRVDEAKAEKIRAALPQVTYFSMAKICAIQPPFDSAQGSRVGRRPGRLSILTAGTADLPVAEEAAVTAELCGFTVARLWDVGVAGIHRLLSNRHVIDESDVLIVAAGMEGALPSVVAGLADCPVVAVPTSVGYGASFNGLAPLLTMLNSCATGIGVVNIDNGFGAAILAGQILRTGSKIEQR